MVKKNRDIEKVFYIYLQNQLKKKALPDGTINRAFANSFICRSHNIPKQISKIIIEELINIGLIKNISRYCIQIVNPKINPVENTSIFYRKLGLF